MPADMALRWIMAEALAWGRGGPGQLFGATADRPEQWTLRILGKVAPLDIGVQVFLEIVMAGQRVLLAAFSRSRISPNNLP